MLWIDSRPIPDRDIVATIVYLFVYATIRIIIWLWHNKYGIFWFATFALLGFGWYRLVETIYTALNGK